MFERMPLLSLVPPMVLGVVAIRSDLLQIKNIFFLIPALIMVGCFRPLRRLAGGLALGLALGAASLVWDAMHVCVDVSWLQHPWQIKARVVDVKAYADMTRLELAEVKREDGMALPGRVWLYLYGQERHGWQRQDGLQGKLRFRRPRNAGNPGAFDFESFCFDRHIALLASASTPLTRLPATDGWMEAWRKRIRHQVKRLPEETQGVVEALVLGDRSRIESEMRLRMAFTGTAHLLAISGLHLALVGGWAFACCWYLLTRREQWIVQLPVRELCMLAAVLATFVYGTLAQWPLPTQRAFFMLFAASVAWWLRSAYQPMNIMLAALGFILLFEPQACTSPSLWLSFCATSALLVLLQRQRRDHAFISLVKVSFIVALATLPLVAHSFLLLPVYGILANLLLVPLYTVVILAMSLLGAVMALLNLPASYGPLILAAWGVQAGDAIAEWFTKLPGGRMWIAEPSLAASLAYSVGMIFAFHLWRRGKRVASLGLVVAFLGAYCISLVQERPPTYPHWVAWHVGQGAGASLLMPDGFVLVVDAPGRPVSRFNGGQRSPMG